ncbi:hypothetical protein JNB_17493 [Janibacter sp. HTCC2649]|uniref:hypothetical protein n=1 Tax=Janibacter sp. HTCC2649 TaxID=313589 RepID=UPI0000671040|nr:hypothetical protein [Janibacter sp. HTCC2649]EAP97287.1 hypothetical protein JNB_17493 [Janibacter sp. HTCC2649]
MDRRPSTRTSDFASTLDAAIRERGLTLAELRRRLEHLGTPISESALRFWRTGARRPEHRHSLDVLDNLEDILGLGRGDLTARLGPSRRLRRSRADATDSIAGTPGVLQPLLETIGCVDLAELERLSDSVVIEIGADRRIRSASNRSLWRSRVEGGRRLMVPLSIDSPTESRPTISVRGAEEGRWAYDSATGWAVWELLLPRGLAIGETAVVEYSCTDIVDTEDVTHFACSAERRLAHAGLWVRFDGDPPRWNERIEEDDTGLSTSVISPMGSSVHRTVQDFGPGLFGLRWTW